MPLISHGWLHFVFKIPSRQRYAAYRKVRNPLGGSREVLVDGDPEAVQDHVDYWVSRGVVTSDTRWVTGVTMTGVTGVWNQLRESIEEGLVGVLQSGVHCWLLLLLLPHPCCYFILSMPHLQQYPLLVATHA
jgi:hypothetical protein